VVLLEDDLDDSRNHLLGTELGQQKFESGIKQRRFAT
jgi:hypothetical protein